MPDWCPTETKDLKAIAPHTPQDRSSLQVRRRRPYDNTERAVQLATSSDGGGGRVCVVEPLPLRARHFPIPEAAAWYAKCAAAQRKMSSIPLENKLL